MSALVPHSASTCALVHELFTATAEAQRPHAPYASANAR